MIGRWSGPRSVFVCQLVEVIREDDSNEKSGELGLALPGNLVHTEHGYLVGGPGFWCTSPVGRRRCLGLEES